VNVTIGAVLLLPLGLLQVTLVPGVGGLYPNLVLAAVIAWTCLRGPRPALPWAVAGGLVCDLGSWGAFGPHALAMLAAVYCVGLVQRSLDLDRFFLLLASGAGGTAVYALAVLVLGTLQGQPPDPRQAWEPLLAEAALTALLVPLAALPLRLLRNRRWPLATAAEG
jgi:rod shape-determining protein MreD